MIGIPKQLRRLSTCDVLRNVLDPADGVALDRSIFGQQKTNIKPKIGLEVHAQLKVKSKLFSRGGNTSQGAPNSQLDLLDISIPGALPFLNGQAVRVALVAALGLNCTIQDRIHFDRKNYFYTDLPAGYQITQNNSPLAKDGYVEFIVTSQHRSIIAHSSQYDIVKYLYQKDSMLDGDFVPYVKRSHIKQLQLEQDSAKTLSDNSDSGLVDYNRSGIGLMEIVFEPDLVNPYEAASLVRELISILKQLRACDCELQEGSLRVDANVSIESIDEQVISDELAGRVELKNLNSLRSLTKGIAYEIRRQSDELAAGNKVERESRTYDTKSGRTKLLRVKETAMDYRYVPEPSIPPLRIHKSLVNELRGQMSQLTLPAQWRDRLDKEFHLDLILIGELLNEPGLPDYFCSIMSGHESKFDANVVADFLVYSVKNLKRLNQLPMQVDLNDSKGDFATRLSAEKMQRLFTMLFADEISFTTAQEVMKCLFTSASPSDPRQLVKQLEWFQVNDYETIRAACEKLVAGMKNIPKQYKRKGELRHMRMMLEKLSEQHDNRINLRVAIKCFDELLRDGRKE